MPDVTVGAQRMSAERTAAVLREELGDRYAVALSDAEPDTITVRRAVVARALVPVHPDGAGTRLEVRARSPFLLNVLWTQRRVARALEDARRHGAGAPGRS